MTVFRTLVSLTLLAMLIACRSSEPSKNAEPPKLVPQAVTTSNQPNAMEVARVLKDAGIPFLDEWKGIRLPMDTSPGTPGSNNEVNNDAGIVYSAVTATVGADVDITIFSTREKLAQAKSRVQKIEKEIGDISYFAEEGCIWVNIREDEGKPSEIASSQAERIKVLLKKKYAGMMTCAN